MFESPQGYQKMKYIKGVCLLTIAMFLFSFIGVFARFSGKDPFSVSFYRAIFSMLIFFCLYLGRHPNVKVIEKIKGLGLSKKSTRIIFPYGLSVAITILTFICSYLYTTMANTVLLHYLMPIFVFLGSFGITGEKILPRSIIGFSLALLGVALITGFDLIRGASGRALLGDLLALISGISYAGIILWTRKARLMNIDIVYFVFWGWTIAGIFCLPFILLFGNFSLSSHAFLAILGLSIFSTVLPFIISNIALKYLSAQASSIIAYSEVIFVMLWGTLFYSETVTRVTIMGAGLIFFALFIMSQSEKRLLLKKS